MWSGARWAGAICGVTFETLNPRNGAVLTGVAAGDVANVEAAVVAELPRSGSRQATGGVSELPAK
jgi:acyl-CoA reductase-like NAD-dependent aldehyde dehydrogenase